MNREILFRGKRVDNGDWIEGYFLVAAGMIFISVFGVRSPIQVDCDTVGQYTGLTDKNGERVFEGDILKYVNEDDENHYIKVVFEDCAFLIEDKEIIDSDLLTSYVCLGIEIAGNIHDNPELLEER